MNAFGAALQQNDEVADYAILSSYLDPVVSRPSSETRAFGTLSIVYFCFTRRNSLSSPVDNSSLRRQAFALGADLDPPI